MNCNIILTEGKNTLTYDGEISFSKLLAAFKAVDEIMSEGKTIKTKKNVLNPVKTIVIPTTMRESIKHARSLGYKETGSSVAVPIFRDFILRSKTNENKKSFRVPSGLSFVNISQDTGLPSNETNSIMEAFIEGTEPYSSEDIYILDSLGVINNSISGTGGLLNN